MWILKFRAWNLSSVLWIIEWVLLPAYGTRVTSGFDPARCCLSAGGPSQEILHASSRVAAAAPLLCVFKRDDTCMAESHMPEGEKEAAPSRGSGPRLSAAFTLWGFPWWPVLVNSLPAV